MCTKQKVDGSRWLTHDGLPPEEGVVVLAVEEGDGDAQGAGRVPVGARPQEQRTEEDDAPDRVEEDGDERHTCKPCVLGRGAVDSHVGDEEAAVLGDVVAAGANARQW